MMPFASSLLVSAAAVAGGGHGATCVFFTQPVSSPPVDVISGSSGTLVGATADTGNSLLHTPGTATTYATFPTSSGNFDVLSGTPFTLEFHIRNLAATDGGGVMGRGSQSGGAGRWLLFATGSSGGLQVYFDGIGGSPVLSAASTAFAADGVYRHVAMVRNGSTWRLYIAGNQVASASGIGAGFSATDGSGPLYIGNDPVDLGGRAVAADYSRIKISHSELYTGASFTPPSRFDP